ncbi:MAG: CHAD domain-containing protein [Pseudomonadota bacterium]
MAGFRSEFEIKLIGEPHALAALENSLVVRALKTGRVAHERYQTVYVDTPDKALTGAGFILGRRFEDGAFSQIVKRAGPARAGGERAEREQHLPLAADFPLATGDARLDALIETHTDDFAPVLRLDVRRRAFRLSRGRTRIEAAFDVCLATGPDETAALFHEAELELIKGDRRDVFAVAALCLEEAGGGLRASATSKPARALAMMRGEGAGPANRIEIDPEGCAGDALARALGFCAARVCDLSGAVGGGRDVEAARQMRVALRRFRSVERLFRKAASDPALAALAAQAREAARIIGAARDWDVFLADTAPEVEKRYADHGPKGSRPNGLLRPKADFDGLRAVAEERRAVAWDVAAAHVAAPDFAVFALNLLQSADRYAARPDRTKALRRPVRRFASRALDKRLAAAARLAVDLHVAAPSAGHPLRIALKKLRYTAQLFRDVYPREARRPYMRAMSRLQDDFGVLNDAVVAQGLAADAGEGGGPALARAAGLVGGYRAASARAAADRVADNWEAFAALAPFWRAEPSTSGAPPSEDAYAES